jgi:hypothetical protein
MLRQSKETVDSVADGYHIANVDKQYDFRHVCSFVMLKAVCSIGRKIRGTER